MNTSDIVSFASATGSSGLAGKEHTNVKLTSTGIALAGATDIVIGTLLRGNPNGDGFPVDIFLSAGKIHFVTVGNNTAIAIGDALQRAANGTMVKWTAGNVDAYAWGAAPSTSSGGQIEALVLYSTASAEPLSAHQIVASGTYTWGSSSVATETVTVAGVLSTDTVTAAVAVSAAGEYILTATAEAGDIVLVLSANGTTPTTKVNYTVVR